MHSNRFTVVEGCLPTDLVFRSLTERSGGGEAEKAAGPVQLHQALPYYTSRAGTKQISMLANC